MKISKAHKYIIFQIQNSREQPTCLQVLHTTNNICLDALFLHLSFEIILPCKCNKS